MAVENILREISQDISDVQKTKFSYTDTRVVPGGEDVGLTYERGAEKKGKKLQTCVLYVDIRNSVGLTEKHHNLTMGKIYTAFTKAVLKIARHHNGHTRNIIGDRVMIVFPSENCFTNAVDCAISINYVAHSLINKQFEGVDFKCGIGIDYGELRIIKVGIQRNGTERGENKGLVWAGYPANVASRLTDNANKVITDTYFEVAYNPINYAALFPLINAGPVWQTRAKAPPSIYLDKIETQRLTTDEFAQKTKMENGQVSFNLGKLIGFSQKTDTYTFPPILMTQSVFNGFKAANSQRDSIKNNYWKEHPHSIKNVNEKIFGGDVTWKINM